MSFSVYIVWSEEEMKLCRGRKRTKSRNIIWQDMGAAAESHPAAEHGVENSEYFTTVVAGTAHAAPLLLLPLICGP